MPFIICDFGGLPDPPPPSPEEVARRQRLIDQAIARQLAAALREEAQRLRLIEERERSDAGGGYGTGAGGTPCSTWNW